MEIFKILAKLQSEIKVPKNNWSDFGSYKFRSCEDILSIVKPLVLSHGLILTMSEDVELIGERYYIKSTVVLTDIDSGESVKSTAFAREELERKKMDASQLTGASTSYARKYALCGLFCIDDSNDADSLNNFENYTTTMVNSQVVCPVCKKRYTGHFELKNGKKSKVSVFLKKYGMCIDCLKLQKTELSKEDD